MCGIKKKILENKRNINTLNADRSELRKKKKGNLEDRYEHLMEQDP